MEWDLIRAAIAPHDSDRGDSSRSSSLAIAVDVVASISTLSNGVLGPQGGHDGLATSVAESGLIQVGDGGDPGGVVERGDGGSSLRSRSILLEVEDAVFCEKDGNRNTLSKKPRVGGVGIFGGCVDFGGGAWRAQVVLVGPERKLL
jgi:hypothetical protein